MQKMFKGLVLAVAGAVSLSSAAFAQDTLQVVYGDLDLSRPEGAAQFDLRTNEAVKAFCEENAGRSLAEKSTCRRAAKAELAASLPQAQRDALVIARSSQRAAGFAVAAR